MLKKIYLEDEHSVTWTLIAGDPDFEPVASLKLREGDYACFRDHLVIGLKDCLPVEEARDRLEDVTTQCLEAIQPDESLLDRCLHAAKSFTLLHALREANA